MPFAFLGFGVPLGGVDQGLAARVAVGPAAAGGIPVDSALGVAGRVLGTIGGFAGEAAGEFLGLFFPLPFFALSLGGRLRFATARQGGVFRGLLGVAGLLLEEKKSLAHSGVEG